MQRIALLKAMANRKGQAETLPEDRHHVEPRIERVWLSHQGNVERAGQKQLGKASGDVSTTLTSMPGCCSRKSFRNPTKRSGPIVHITPRVSGAASSLRKLFAATLAVSVCCSTCSRCERMRRPKSVNRI